MRCAIIGLGMAAAPHAKSLADLRDRVEVAAAYSPTAARRDAFAARFGLPVTADVDGIVDDPSIDYAVLLTPPNARIDLVRRLAAAGKHILMEKPVERTTVAAEEVVATAERAGVTLGIVLQHRFRAVAERLADRLASGALGTIAAVHIVVPWWRPQGYYDEPGRGTHARDGGGVLISQAIHTLDLVLSLAGPVDEVVAVAGTTPLHRMEAEDFVAAGIRFENGAFGSLMATTAFFPGCPGANRARMQSCARRPRPRRRLHPLPRWPRGGLRRVRRIGERRRPDGLPPRCPPRPPRGLHRCRRRGPGAARHRIRGAEGSPFHRRDRRRGARPDLGSGCPRPSVNPHSPGEVRRAGKPRARRTGREGVTGP